MVHATTQRWRPGRAQSLVLGALFLSGAFGLLHLEAAPPAEGEKEKKAGVVGKGPAGPVGLTAQPPLRMTFASKDADVREMTTVINTKLEASWKANKIVPSAYIDDHESLRRPPLDIIGRIAKPEEIRAYMKDPPDQRRSLLIERLLKHEDYARHWANLWS